MKILIIIALTLWGLTMYAGYWGNRECKFHDGNWININGGYHCVDDNFSNIEIYSK